MTRVQLALIVAALAAVAVLAPTSAGAKQNAVKPETGNYAGTAKVSGKSHQSTASVRKRGGKMTISLILAPVYNCQNGGTYPLPITFEAPLNGKAFGASSGTDDPIYGEYTYTLKGEFTSSTALKGTLVVEGVFNNGGENPSKCTTGTISYSMKKK
jgi:hypothetical protein